MDAPPRRFPVLTVVATVVAVAAAVAQYAIPAMIPALQRVPGGGVPDGQWWRLVTPLAVQTLGWYQVAANLVTLAVVGGAAERLLGRGWWLALAAAGTIGGQLSAYYFRDDGGGDSIAICGLAGGVIALLAIRPAAGTRFAHRAVVWYVAALTGWSFFGFRAALAALVVAVAGLAVLHWLGVPGASWLPLACCAACAVALAGPDRDPHGASLIAGMACAGIGLALTRPAPQAESEPVSAAVIE